MARAFVFVCVCVCEGASVRDIDGGRQTDIEGGREEGRKWFHLRFFIYIHSQDHKRFHLHTIFREKEQEDREGKHARTHTHARTHSRARAHTHTHTYTYTQRQRKKESGTYSSFAASFDLRASDIFEGHGVALLYQHRLGTIAHHLPRHQ